MRGVEGVVRSLQQIGHDERRVRHGHRDDARRQPSRGVTAASSTPSATQLSAERTSAAPSPANPPRSIQASANSGSTSSALAGRAPCESQPRASAARRGHGAQRQIGEPLALARSAARAMSTKAITDTGGIAAQRRPRSRASHAAAGARGTATTAPWARESSAIDSQKGGITRQHRSAVPRCRARWDRFGPGARHGAIEEGHVRRARDHLRLPGARTRLYQLGALLVTAGAIAAVLVAVLSSGSTSQLAPGRPVPGAAQTLALLAGIPQRGIALGNPRAPVTLVEFGDLQCPSCALFAQEALPAIVSRYVRPGRVLLVFRGLDFIGQDSQRAARMASALGEQNRLFQFVDLMYRNQGLENSSYVTDTYLRALAGAIPGVDVARALAARGSAGVQAQLLAARALARALGLKSTPSFLLYRSGAPPALLPRRASTPSSFSQATRQAARRRWRRHDRVG